TITASATTANMAGTCEIILLVILTILFPPAGVACVAGCGCDLLINILLTCLGYFPGHIHAFYIEYSMFPRPSSSKASRDSEANIAQSIPTAEGKLGPDTLLYNQRRVSTASESTILRSFMGVLNGRLSEFSHFEPGMARDAHGN